MPRQSREARARSASRRTCTTCRRVERPPRASRRRQGSAACPAAGVARSRPSFRLCWKSAVSRKFWPEASTPLSIRMAWTFSHPAQQKASLAGVEAAKRAGHDDSGARDRAGPLPDLDHLRVGLLGLHVGEDQDADEQDRPRIPGTESGRDAFFIWLSVGARKVMGMVFVAGDDREDG